MTLAGRTYARRETGMADARISILRWPVHSDGVADIDCHEVHAEFEGPSIGLARRSDVIGRLRCGRTGASGRTNMGIDCEPRLRR
jgi:hypothetical protein